FCSLTAATTTQLYRLSLHDALPIWRGSLDPDGRARRRPRLREPDEPPSPGPAALLPRRDQRDRDPVPLRFDAVREQGRAARRQRSEEHTSELQSRSDLVCRLLLEKK